MSYIYEKEPAHITLSAGACAAYLQWQLGDNPYCILGRIIEFETNWYKKPRIEEITEMVNEWILRGLTGRQIKTCHEEKTVFNDSNMLTVLYNENKKYIKTQVRSLESKLNMFLTQCIDCSKCRDKKKCMEYLPNEDDAWHRGRKKYDEFKNHIYELMREKIDKREFDVDFLIYYLVCYGRRYDTKEFIKELKDLGLFDPI